MNPVLAAAVFAAVAPVVIADGAGEMGVVREALRDGMWNVARAHAIKDGSDEGRLAVLESFAREERWGDVLRTLDEWGDARGEGFTCYRAAALFRTGRAGEAKKLLSETEFSDPANVRAAARTLAEIALAAGDAKEALKHIERCGESAETDLLKADALSAAGDLDGAKAIWRRAAGTNSSERVQAEAAVRLGEIPLLREVCARIGSAGLRRLCGFHLGVALLKDGATFDEGAKMVSSLVRDSPDADGARDVFLALAEARLERGEWQEASKIYDEALETWPDISKNATFQEGRGWALSKLGRNEDALVAFDRAAELSTNRASKAASLARAGDTLAALGRGAEAMERYRTVSRDYSDTEAAAKLADLLRLQELEDEGRSQYAEYRFADAQKTFEKVAVEDPSRRPRMEFYAVLCLYGQGRDADAEKRARAMAGDSSMEPAIRAEATLWLAKFAYNKARWKEASSRFADFAAILPDSPDAPAALVWSARAAFAENDCQRAVSTVGALVARYPESEARAAGLLVQGEALIELARFDEAVLVLERAALANGATQADRLRAQMLRADALFAMGADNTARYVAALEAYRTILLGENGLSPSQRLSLSFKIGKTLERLKRAEEAVDQYYTQVVLAYRSGREKGLRYDDTAKADFARAAFRLAEECESRGYDEQALGMLRLVSRSDVPAAAEAARRIDRIKRKGAFL